MKAAGPVVSFKKRTPPSGGPKDPSVTRSALEGEEGEQPTNCDPHVHHSWWVIRGSRLILTSFRLFQRVFFHPPFAPPLSLFSPFFFFFFWALVGSPCGPAKFNFQSFIFQLLNLFWDSFHCCFIFSFRFIFIFLLTFLMFFSLHCSVHGFSIFPSFSFDFTVC